MKALTQLAVLEELGMISDAMNAPLGDVVLCYSSDLADAVAATFTNPRGVATRQESQPRVRDGRGTVFVERAATWPPGTWRVYPLEFTT